MNLQVDSSTQKGFKLHNQKLRKRTLRAKITKIVYENFFYKCPKQQKRERLSDMAEDKKIKIRTKEYFERITQPNYNTRSFTMTPYNPKEHVPGTKSQTAMKNPIETVHPKVISISELDKVEKYIKTKLSRNDLLEIGEDPAYFIQNQKLRFDRHENHIVSKLNQLNWVNDFWLEKDKAEAPPQQLRIKPISEDSHLLKKKEIKRELTYDPIALKNQMLTDRQEMLKNENKKRFEAFLNNYQREKLRQELMADKLNKRYQQKLKQTDERLKAMQMGQQIKQEAEQRANQERLEQLEKNLKFKRENNDLMAQKRQRLEQQVEKNVEDRQQQKLQRVKSVTKSVNI